MITERDRAIWRAALTLANNLCVQHSDRCNDDDEPDEAHSASMCAERVRAWIDATDEQLCDIFSEAWVDGAAPKVKPLIWDNFDSAETILGELYCIIGATGETWWYRLTVAELHPHLKLKTKPKPPRRRGTRRQLGSAWND